MLYHCCAVLWPLGHHHHWNTRRASECYSNRKQWESTQKLRAMSWPSSFHYLSPMLSFYRRLLMMMFDVTKKQSSKLTLPHSFARACSLSSIIIHLSTRRRCRNLKTLSNQKEMKKNIAALNCRKINEWNLQKYIYSSVIIFVFEFRVHYELNFVEMAELRWWVWRVSRLSSSRYLQIEKEEEQVFRKQTLNW